MNLEFRERDAGRGVVVRSFMECSSTPQPNAPAQGIGPPKIWNVWFLDHPFWATELCRARLSAPTTVHLLRFACPVSGGEQAKEHAPEQAEQEARDAMDDEELCRPRLDRRG
jgi:hypothetical protein